MHYESFLDHIIAEGCVWLKNYDLRFGAYFQNNHNSKVAFLKKDAWVPWPIVIAFCKDIGIDIPAHLQDKEEEFMQIRIYQ